MRFGAHETDAVNGLPVTTPLRTWVDLAPHLSLGELVAVGDAIIASRRPLARRVDLIVALRDHDCRKGRPRARTALDLLDGDSESPMESILRVLLWEAGFAGFVCNLDIRDGHHRFVARGDLVDVKARLVVEYEGDHHRTDMKQWHRDIARTADLHALGWTVFRVTNRDLHHPARLLARLRGHYRKA
jgi:very-short-patch-repair endonuclease